ncbi:MAG TPA: ATP-binding protein [Verrucomicrobiae bacterium]|nr:ATP-binding protein [Verrucomicrobiae bacterium]
MNVAPLRASTQDLERQKDEIRRGLFRVNTALLVIVAVVIGLALAGVFAAFRASQRTLQATAASQSAQDQLWQSYLAQATAGRLSTAPGRKAKGREVIEAAARIRPSLQLRNECIAHRTLLDLAGDHVEKFSEQNLTWAYAPDLTRYAQVTSAGRVEISSLPEHRALLAWQSPATNISLLMFSPNSRFLIVSYRSGGFHVLDLQTGSASVKGPSYHAIDFSFDGSVIGLLVEPQLLQFVESSSGKPTRPPLSLPAPARDLAFDQSGRQVALNLGRSIQIWDWQRGEKTAVLEYDVPLYSMAWSGQQLALGDETGGIHVYDVASHRRASWVAHKSLVDTVFFSHQGDLLVSDSWDGSCKVWNPRTGQLLLSTTRGFGLCFSADDRNLAYVVRTSALGSWGWWPLSMPQGLRTVDCVGASPPNAFQVDFSPDGHTLIVTESDELRLLDARSGRPLLLEPIRNCRSAYFLPDGKHLLTYADNQAAVFALEEDPHDGQRMRLGPPRVIASSQVHHLDSARVSEDRSQAAFLANDSDVVLLDLKDPSHQVLFRGADKPALPALSPDKHWLVTGTFHGRGSIVWDAATGRKVRDLDPGNSNPFFSPDGSLLVCAGDKEYRVYDCPSWNLRYRVSTESAIDLPNYAAFSPAGHELAIVKERQFVELIEPRGGSVLASLVTPEPQIITWLTFSPAGDFLAVGTAAGLVQIWNLDDIHRDLAALGLDWNTLAPGAALAGPTEASPGLSLNSARFAGPAMAGVGLVLFCAWFVLRRQRQLFASYLLIDDLMEQRNRELKVAQTELMHSQKMKALGTLAAGIAHDFNNLLSVIRMSNKLIGREVKGNPDVEENVQEVEKAVQQGKHIVGSMLGFSSDQNKGRTALFVPDLVEDTVGLLSRQFLSGITLDLQLDRESPAVQLPRAGLEQILLNLIVNAAEAMQGHGHLRIQVREVASGTSSGSVRAPRPAPTYVELTVADTGCGIPPEIVPRIFDPFFTTKADRANRGTGLGLSMIYTMAEQDGLGVEVQSAVGQGATFRILIPVDPAPPPRDAAPQNQHVREWHTGQSPGAE